MNKDEVIEYLKEKLPDDKYFEISGIDLYSLSHNEADINTDNIFITWRTKHVGL